MTLVAVVLVAAGLFFMSVSAVGLLRLPDFYSRVHGVSKADTLGIALVLLGLIAYVGLDRLSLKLLLVMVFVYLTTPIAAHVLTRAAVRRGLMPWRRAERRPAAGERD